MQHPVLDLHTMGQCSYVNGQRKRAGGVGEKREHIDREERKRGREGKGHRERERSLITYNSKETQKGSIAVRTIIIIASCK